MKLVFEDPNVQIFCDESNGPSQWTCVYIALSVADVLNFMMEFSPEGRASTMAVHLHQEQGISYVDDRRVIHLFLPPDMNPALLPIRHEAVHAVLGWVTPAQVHSREYPQWLDEGVAQWAAVASAKPDELVWCPVLERDIAQSGDTHRSARVELAALSPDERGKVLDAIGSNRCMPELRSEARNAYARAFYAAARSFVGWLDANGNLMTALACPKIFDAIQRIEEGGKTIETLKKEWLRSIKVV